MEQDKQTLHINEAVVAKQCDHVLAIGKREQN